MLHQVRASTEPIISALYSQSKLHAYPPVQQENLNLIHQYLGTHLATLSTCFGNALGAHLLLVLVEVVSSLFVLPTTDHT